MVELFEGDIKDDGRKSSKGNQLKWQKEDIWYKADYLGYEGLAECVASALLKRSSLSADEFVIYEPESIRYKSQVYNGCRSMDFAAGWQTITLERLFKNRFGTGLNQGIYSIEDHEQRLKFLVDCAERITGLKDFGKYICKLFTIDAFFLNEDRHTHNISVLMNKDEFRYCPIYDNGAALLSDMSMDYPMGCDVYEEINNVHAKTICESFDEQLDIAEKLYGRQLVFTFSAEDIRNVLNGIGLYDDAVKQRVELILLQQRRKYGNHFAK